MIIKKKMKDFSMREGLRQKGYMAILWAQTTDLAPLMRKSFWGLEGLKDTIHQYSLKFKAKPLNNWALNYMNKKMSSKPKPIYGDAFKSN